MRARFARGWQPCFRKVGRPQRARCARRSAGQSQERKQIVDEDKLLHDVAEHEREALESYGELGMTDDLSEEQAYQEEVASGEVSRELREMRHGEFGPKVYEWLEEDHEQTKEP